MAPQRVVVEYDGSYWHSEGAALQARQRSSWERAGYRVVRLRETPLPPTSQWDVVLPRPFRSYADELVSAAIALHVLEAAPIASIAERTLDRTRRAAPQGWWVARDVRGDVRGEEVAQWRTWPAAQLGLVAAFRRLERDWYAGEVIGDLEFVSDAAAPGGMVTDR